MDRSAVLAVGDEQAGRETAKWNQPWCISEAHMKWAGPDVFLIFRKIPDVIREIIRFGSRRLTILRSDKG